MMVFNKKDRHHGITIKISAILATILLFSSLTGCEYFWPGKGDNKVLLPIEVTAAKNEYFSQPVKLGTVERSRKMTMTNYGGTEFFFYTVQPSEYSLFKNGETGKLTIDTTLPDDPNHGKLIVYDAKVILTPVYPKDQYVVQITVKIDPSIVYDGVRAEFKILAEKKNNVIVIPLSAIRYYNQIAIVGVLINGTREDRVIKQGIIGDEMVEVLSGLSVGDNIVFQ
ncbi:MAG: efflux RND transporter periplasmic adaptor subunit [Saccharofermentanales bacterium]